MALIERFAVLGAPPRADGRMTLILLDDTCAFVTPDTTDAELRADYQLNKVIRMPPIDFCATICLNGPLAGQTGYGINEFGYQVEHALRAGLAPPTTTYELVKLSQDGRPAELRHVPDRPAPGAYR